MFFTNSLISTERRILAKARTKGPPAKVRQRTRRYNSRNTKEISLNERICPTRQAAALVHNSTEFSRTANMQHKTKPSTYVPSHGWPKLQVAKFDGNPRSWRKFPRGICATLRDTNAIKKGPIIILQNAE
jgi:hypothetical protein